ncbi:iron chelate uptake ABC transporter family permease subunit [Clostridium sp. NSJ-49]|uniref:Iron chelate uptake ABC transporter permease n=1 Tax=Clostridium disporicum TaxID=84024 RepID=A0A174ISU6_9CLOT|nr:MULTISPECIES: iron chelate uptake ABC transporter family permease subunit [Clostridium]MBC5624716.1 iron chelate uptake ABC transporter family permease subunit [Clostridium sp. NSJ-49]MCD2501990.1 iron chelate uptake ABC transporter family permease subunit [Clostridium sp. NSJ-145]MDU6341324.1 iron chelate uptake ABC transporter family permease subunit [Clostridium sp.]CUO90492.1 iron chelate uptake ABC transporter permease [Clostridium disporicum]
MKNNKKLIILSIVAVALIGLFLTIGVNSANYQYAMYRRIPKVIAMVLTGAAIGFSSLIFQTVTNNRILTPSILGLDSLYVLLQTTVVFLLGSSSVLITNGNINFIITIVVMIAFSAVLYKFVFRKGTKNIFTILLIGVICGTLFESLTNFMQVLIDPTEFLTVQDKMMASFNNVNTDIMLLASIVIILSIAYCYDIVKVLDVMSLGRDEAISLGVDYDKMSKKILVIVVILTSVSTALVGPITFLGLLVVNIARQMINTYKHEVLGLATIIISVIALVGGQLIVEQLLDFGTSVSVIINFIGGIYFIYLVMKERNR